MTENGSIQESRSPRKWIIGSPRLVWALSLSIVVLGMWMKRQLMPTHRYLPWHQTKQWVDFLKVYDEQLHKYYLSKGCVAKLLATTYGRTHVVACGSPNHKPVFFFHGGASNGLLTYGEWIVPKIQSKNRFAIVVDTLCDTGRSLPFNSDPNRCPRTSEEMADWARQVILHPDLNAKAPASLVGYSYGSQISFLTARYHPNIVEKLALLAPACIFDAFNPVFMMRYLLVVLVPTRSVLAWFWKWMSSNNNFELTTSLTPDQLQQVEGNLKVGGTMIIVPPEEFDDDVVNQVASNHDIFVGTASNDRALKNVTRFVERAQEAGVKTVRVYPGVGHLMLVQMPETIERDVVAFLTA